MTLAQEKAARAVKRALDNAGKAGLQGGVFDGAFCVWPLGTDPHDEPEFFTGVETIGGQVLTSKISLDGGAGN